MRIACQKTGKDLALLPEFPLSSICIIYKQSIYFSLKVLHPFKLFLVFLAADLGAILLQFIHLLLLVVGKYFSIYLLWWNPNLKQFRLPNIC